MIELMSYNDGGRVIRVAVFGYWVTLWDAPKRKRKRDARRRLPG
jgi:hypothetical protein